MVWLGGLSYAIYLVNEPVQKLLGLALARIAGGDGWLFSLLWCPLALALPVAIAAFLHHWIELPAMRWGRRLAHRSAAFPPRRHPSRSDEEPRALPQM
jgi:peptidoglycan/LPS O-acetylase OafA/YrhL